MSENTVAEYYALDFGNDPEVQELLRTVPFETLKYSIKLEKDETVLVRLNGMLFEGRVVPTIGTDVFIYAENSASKIRPLATATKRIILTQFLMEK